MDNSYGWSGDITYTNTFTLTRTIADNEPSHNTVLQINSIDFK